MKKFISLMLVFVLAFSLCACSEEAPITEEQIEQAAEELVPALEELAAQAEQMYYSGDYDEVFSALSELKDSGLDMVNELLGLCHYYGIGTEIDSDAAMALLEEAAAKGSAAAKYLFAKATMIGDGTVQDPELAEKLYAEFVEAAKDFDINELQAGSVFAALSDCYAKGMGTDMDIEKAKDAAWKAIEAGDLSVFELSELADFLRSTATDARDNVEYQLGDMGISLEDLKLRLEEYRTTLAEAAEDMDTTELEEAIKSYELIFDKLELADKEFEQSSKLYAQAKAGIIELAETGNAKALKLLGDYYFGALGGETQDYAKALEYYTMAADQNNADAQAQLGLMYQDGLGVEVNYEQAMEWNNRAAQQGNAQGQAQIGYLYHMGLGVTQNLDEAGRWYSRAADQGDTWAAAKLAETEITNPQLAFEFHA